jgi:hypothetical protein
MSSRLLKDVDQRRTVSVHGTPLRCDYVLHHWLKDCPDYDRFVDIAKRVVWLQGTAKCAECGMTFKRKYLRWDVVRPGGDPSKEMLCKACWENAEWESSEMGHPEWPEYVDRDEHGPPLEDGTILLKSTGDRIGSVEGYDRRHHFAKKCEIFGTRCSDAGFLDDDTEVVSKDAAGNKRPRSVVEIFHAVKAGRITGPAILVPESQPIINTGGASLSIVDEEDPITETILVE